MSQDEKFTIELDEKHQIIRQHIYGNLDEPLALEIVASSEALAQKLKNPEKAKILVYLDRVGMGTSRGRKALIENLKRQTLYKVAFLSGNPYMKVMETFVTIALGRDKLRLFTKETEAVRWLQE